MDPTWREQMALSLERIRNDARHDMTTSLVHVATPAKRLLRPVDLMVAARQPPRGPIVPPVDFGVRQVSMQTGWPMVTLDQMNRFVNEHFVPLQTCFETIDPMWCRDCSKTDALWE